MTASAAAAHGHDRVAVYKAVPVAMAAALTEGLSIEASLDGLSLGADPHTPMLPRGVSALLIEFNATIGIQCCVKNARQFYQDSLYLNPIIA